MMKVSICRTGNLSVMEDGRGLAVVDPVKGEVVYWNCTAPRTAIQQAVSNYLDKPVKSLDWTRYKHAIEGN